MWNSAYKEELRKHRLTVAFGGGTEVEVFIESHCTNFNMEKLCRIIWQL